MRPTIPSTPSALRPPTQRPDAGWGARETQPPERNIMPEQDPRTAETFVAAIGGIDHGAVAGKADDLLVELVNVVREQGRKGSVTVVLEVRPYKGNSLT